MTRKKTKNDPAHLSGNFGRDVVNGKHDSFSLAILEAAAGGSSFRSQDRGVVADLHKEHCGISCVSHRHVPNAAQHYKSIAFWRSGRDMMRGFSPGAGRLLSRVATKGRQIAACMQYCKCVPQDKMFCARLGNGEGRLTRDWLLRCNRDTHYDGRKSWIKQPARVDMTG